MYHQYLVEGLFKFWAKKVMPKVCEARNQMSHTSKCLIILHICMSLMIKEQKYTNAKECIFIIYSLEQ
jgi:hypothetical protein